MGVPVLILGETGSGKTYSIKGFDPADVGIFSVEKGRLPFKGDYKVIRNASYDKILRALAKPTLKSYVIDDSQYLLVNELFDRAAEAGYGKYTDMAVHFRDLIHTINHKVPDDVIVYFLHHTEYDTNSGKTKAKTVGKMIDQYLTLEGCFDVVLMAGKEMDGYKFRIHTDGYNTVKSPEGMFDEMAEGDYIPNDLKAVDGAVRAYWGL